MLHNHEVKGSANDFLNRTLSIGNRYMTIVQYILRVWHNRLIGKLCCRYKITADVDKGHKVIRWERLYGAAC